MKKISLSVLSISDKLKEKIEEIDSLDIDYIHLDIMDGAFVSAKTWEVSQLKDVLSKVNKKLDVHLMVSDIRKYIDDYSSLNPEYITFHYEATTDPANVLAYIQNKNIKAGMSIKPTTTVSEISKYLPYLDLVLVMSVEPGKGGQEYINDTETKIDELVLLRKENNYDFIIEVDGGINSETIKKCNNADFFVVGSYITNSSSYKESIIKLKSSL